ncbi:MAG: HD domain-containing protein [Clostridium sp.]|jgi:HD-GYP domain-containing protein (c-di-GMP phosphodiesterase class II)|nr:HD domain-containing protein [Clostridium sp.]
MKLMFTELILGLSRALDYVETELIGVQTNHGKRVAYLCSLLGKYAGLGREERLDLAACAVLHDNALSEYIQSEYRHGREITHGIPEKNMGIHCTLGERNVKDFPFFGNCEGAVLYHHENADGSGPFSKREGEISLYAACIHLADQLDAKFSLKSMGNEGKAFQDKWETVREFVQEKEGSLFGVLESSLFLENIKRKDMEKMADNTVEDALRAELGYVEMEGMPSMEGVYFKEYSPEQLMCFSGIFAKIVDYKSTFTCAHSMGVARKAYAMGEYYGWTEELRARFFLAGALHDIGKLAVDVDILEKPGKLTAEEFEQMKNHALVTWQVLCGIRGMEDISRWAAHHHEKLNGKGYPFGYDASRLDRYERLMGCLDIYQALREERPYKPGKSHEETMAMMWGMAEGGFIDRELTADVDKAFRTET